MRKIYDLVNAFY